MRFQEIVASPDLLMGVKAVFGPLKSHMLCFGGRGDPNEPRYYAVARSAAERATGRPWVICIGGGGGVRDGWKGRVLNLARVSSDYGDTAMFAQPEEAERLAQWPIAVVLHDVWRFVDSPHLVDDVGMPDRRVLEAAMDGIVRPSERIQELWTKLRDCELELEAFDLPRNFAPSIAAKLSQNDRRSMILSAQSQEGLRLWALQQKIESSGAVKSAAKEMNRVSNGGQYRCEGCSLVSADAGMLDAHHPTPLAVGVRTTLAAHLQILCPTCHRYAHRATDNRLKPLGLAEIRSWVGSGRV